jgi:hypothetical protein
LETLHGQLWAPIERVLPPGLKRMILSPDGSLNFVSFATLPDANGRFLAERYAVQYVASGRDLLRELAPPSLDHPMAVVFANPDLTRTQSPPIAPADEEAPIVVAVTGGVRGAEKRDLEDLNFSRLPGTQQEWTA